MTKNLFILTLLVFTPIYVSCGDPKADFPSSRDSAVKWDLVFEENFDEESTYQSEWYIYNSPGYQGNGLIRPEAISIENGYLTITAQMKNGILVSGGMGHAENYTYGKFEFKVRTEKDPGAATNGVVLTWPQSERWPIDGENDIYETSTSVSRSPFHTNIHYGESNSQYQFQHNADGTTWHVMAMEWLPNIIRIYRDGQLVFTVIDPDAIPHVPHHICIQLDAFKETMTGKVRMYVDWVKIYQQAD